MYARIHSRIHVIISIITLACLKAQSPRTVCGRSAKHDEEPIRKQSTCIVHTPYVYEYVRTVQVSAVAATSASQNVWKFVGSEFPLALTAYRH